MSGIPPLLAPITGQPAAIASNNTNPRVSVLDGNKNISPDAYALASSSPDK